MKKLIYICCLLLSSGLLQAQDNVNQKLLGEREELIKEYEYLNAQNNNFWGKKSKKDLLLIIDNLKAIIKKDSEIINSVQSEYIRRNTDLTIKTEKLQTERKADTRMISDNLFEMKRQVANLESRDKQRLQKISDLEERVKDMKAAKTEHDIITVFTILFSCFLLYYISRLRGKLRKHRTK